TAITPEVIISNERDVEGASRSVDADGRPAVTVKFNAIGAKRLGDFTTSHVGQPMSIVFDDVILVSPTIKAPIMNGEVLITGDFTTGDADRLATYIRSRPLPAGVEIVTLSTYGNAPEKH